MNRSVTVVLLVMFLGLVGNADEHSTNSHDSRSAHRPDDAGIPKMYSYWESVQHAHTYGILDVPRIGTEKDRNGKPFKHNAASRGYRHGDPDTELAFELIGFLEESQPLSPQTYVWIPVGRRTAFWHEGFYLVPLLKIEKEVTAEHGTVRYTQTSYDLLPGQFPFPRIERSAKATYREALEEWKQLAEDEDNNENRQEKIAFLKRTLRAPLFDKLHVCSLRELRGLDTFKSDFSFEDIEFWCERMNDPDVYFGARRSIADILAGQMRDTALKLDGPDLSEKDVKQLRRRLALLKEEFFVALRNEHTAYSAAQVLSSVFREDLRLELMARIDDPKTRLAAIRLGTVLGDDIEFARKVTAYFAERRDLIETKDMREIGRLQNENCWIEFSSVVSYLLLEENKEGEQLVRETMEKGKQSTSQIRDLIAALIRKKDNRFVDSVHLFTQNALRSKRGDRTGELYAALAYMVMWKHPGRMELAREILGKRKRSEYQEQVCRQYMGQVTAALGDYRRFDSTRQCLEWIEAEMKEN